MEKIFVSTIEGLALSTNGGKTFTVKTVKDGLNSNVIREVYSSGNTVYAATDDGLSIPGSPAQASAAARGSRGGAIPSCP